MAAAALVTTRREAEDWSDDDDDGNTFDVDADALGLLLEICLTRFTCCFARDISAVVVAVERGCSARRRAEDKNIMVWWNSG